MDQMNGILMPGKNGVYIKLFKKILNPKSKNVKIKRILFLGGGTELVNTGFSRAADLLLDLAIAKNEHGIHFPIWGTCMSFQKFATYFTGNKQDWDNRCNAEDISMALDIGFHGAYVFWVTKV